MTSVYRVVTRKRGVVGNLCKWGLVSFNGLTVWWLWAYVEAAITGAGSGMSAVAGTGIPLGSGSGAAVVAILWLIGEATLGGLTFLTRSRMVVFIEERGGGDQGSLGHRAAGPLHLDAAA